MIHKKDLDEYGLESMSGYYNLILISQINGQNDQAERQIGKLSPEQCRGLYHWIKMNSGLDNDYMSVLDKLINNLTEKLS